jgi:hypothetical protein
MNEEIINTYVRPYYQNPDLLADKNKIVLLNWKDSIQFDIELTELLTDNGWRNRVVAATVVGALKLERYITQIFTQAQDLDEYYQAKSYSFTFIRIANNESIRFLEALANKQVNSEYSKNVQKLYKAGLAYLDKNCHLSTNVDKELDLLNNRMNKWKSFDERDE